MNFPPVFSEGMQLSAADLNAAFAEVARLLRINVEAPLEMEHGQGGPTIRLSQVPPFFARITGEKKRPKTGGSGSGSFGGSGNFRGLGEAGGEAGGGGEDTQGSGGGDPNTTEGVPSGQLVSGSGSSSGSGGGCKFSWIEQASRLDTCGLYDAVNGLEGFSDDMPAMGMKGERFNVGDVVRLVLGTTGDHYIAITTGGTSSARKRIELPTSICLVPGSASGGSGVSGNSGGPK